MKKAAGWFLALMLLFPVRALAGGSSAGAPVLLSAPAFPGEDAASTEPDSLWEKSPAKAYCLIDRESGRVLYQYNENERLPMASTTKIMTALLAVERCDMNAPVTAGKNAAGVPGTSIYLAEGETLPMRQMLLGLMLRSGNDAAVAIAEHIGGSVESFAALMNERAAALGVDANFVTPNGLDAPGHGASALAMCRLAAEAMEHGAFREIVSTKNAVIPWEASQYDRALTNKNKLLTTYPEATGIKTGYTSKAGRCLVFSANREGMELIGAVLNCYTWFDSAAELLDAGFERYDLAAALSKGDTAAEVAVSGGSADTVRAIAKEALRAPVAANENWSLSLEIPESVSAPVEKGQYMGEARMVNEDGEILARCELLAEESVEKHGFWSSIWDFFRRLFS